MPGGLFFGAGLTEETYGLPTTGWTGIDLGDGVPRDPVASYEIAFLAVVWLLLQAIERSRPSAMAVGMHVVISLTIAGVSRVSDKDRGRAWLLASLVVLLVGFSTCLGNASLQL